MRRARRWFEVLTLAWAAASLLAPWAAPSPSPSPSLDSVLSPPSGTGYVVDYQGYLQVQGNFQAVDYLVFEDPRHPSHTLATLKDDGFVAGYGREWADRTARHYAFELVVAFKGGQGATKWMPDARSLDQDNLYFKTEFQLSGISNSFGDHFADTNGPFYFDDVGFVKGNDYFYLQVGSGKNDLGDSATALAKQMFDAAPSGTIPTSQWPENATSATPSAASRPNPVGGLPVGLVVIVAVAGVLLLALAVVAIVVIRRGGRPSTTVATPLAVSTAPVPGIVQMSTDGTHWWDGQAWKDVSLEAPPMAQRSADGYYWWDGQKWREVPRPAS
ncbi:MAG TPA: hypothetical protein VHO95_00230 [Candidatus Dormibacteraeota bacterium]|nr:hypothetical protein [Candidatus Dormibacteraeota bacterium]